MGQKTKERKNDNKDNTCEGFIPSEVLEQNKWADSNLQFFANYNGSYQLRTIVVKENQIKTIIYRGYEFLLRNIFLVELIGSKNNILKDVQASVDKIFSDASEQIMVMKHQIQILGKSGIENTSNAKGIEINMPITSKRGAKFIDLLEAADALFQLNDALFSANLLDKKQRFQNQAATRRLLQKVIRDVEILFAQLRATYPHNHQWT